MPRVSKSAACQPEHPGSARLCGEQGRLGGGVPERVQLPPRPRPPKKPTDPIDPGIATGKKVSNRGNPENGQLSFILKTTPALVLAVFTGRLPLVYFTGRLPFYREAPLLSEPDTSSRVK